MPDLAAFDPSYLDAEDQPQTPEELAAWRAKMAAGQQLPQQQHPVPFAYGPDARPSGPVQPFNIPMPQPRGGLNPAALDAMSGGSFGGQAQPQTEVPLPAPMRKATLATTGFTNATSPYQPQVPGVMQSLDPDAAAAVLAATQAQQKPAVAGPMADSGRAPAAKPQSALGVIGGNYYKKVPSDPNESPGPGELMQPGDVGNRYVQVDPPWSAKPQQPVSDSRDMPFGRLSTTGMSVDDAIQGSRWNGSRYMRMDPTTGSLVPDPRYSAEDVRLQRIKDQAQALPGWASGNDRDRLLLLNMAGHQQQQGFGQGINTADLTLRQQAPQLQKELLSQHGQQDLALEALKQQALHGQFLDQVAMRGLQPEDQALVVQSRANLAKQYGSNMGGPQVPMPGMQGGPAGPPSPLTQVPGIPPGRQQAKDIPAGATKPLAEMTPDEFNAYQKNRPTEQDYATILNQAFPDLSVDPKGIMTWKSGTPAVNDASLEKLALGMSQNQPVSKSGGREMARRIQKIPGMPAEQQLRTQLEKLAIRASNEEGGRSNLAPRDYGGLTVNPTLQPASQNPLGFSIFQPKPGSVTGYNVRYPNQPYDVWHQADSNFDLFGTNNPQTKEAYRQKLTGLNLLLQNLNQMGP